MPDLAHDDSLLEELEGLYDEVLIAIRDQTEAKNAQLGWSLGMLPLDPDTNAPDPVFILTAKGPLKLYLDQGSCGTYLLVETACLATWHDIVVSAHMDAAGAWSLIALPFPDADPMIVGIPVTVPSLRIPGEPIPDDAVVLGMDNFGPSLETSNGPSRWFLVPGFHYLLHLDRTTSRWHVREAGHSGT